MKESKELKRLLEKKIGKPLLYVRGVFVANNGDRYSIAKARRLTGAWHLLSLVDR